MLSEQHMDTFDESLIVEGKKWEWSFLRRKCKNMELEEYYQIYKQRLCVSYLSLFTLLQIPIMGVHSLILLATVAELNRVVPDILTYMISAIVIWVIMYANLREEFVKKHQYVVYLTSWLAISILALMDIGITLYHATDTRDILRPTYSGYTIFAIYLFMPLPNYVHPFILGMAVTVVYLINHGTVTLNRRSDGSSDLHVGQLVGEAVFLVCCNLLGIFFRMMQEIAIRTTFLDRRQFVEENLLLRYARDQEKSLLLSIIPAQIANRIEQDVKVRIERLKKHSQRKFANTGEGSTNPQVIKRWRQPDSEKLFIEPHTDVSILYADVVNYTYLTTTLDVKTLVETLHDLFVKFDIASEEYNVLRIKFLGDCYYCVAGVPIPNEDHAKCCVDLGLCMIKDIREVREKRRLNIDMRIGVHSGNILSGVIGACKWQFDIWSKDVDIANRLEQTGVAGRVHVSEQTLQLLDGEYLYEEGTQGSRDDVVLKKYGIRSFLIKTTRSSSASHQQRASGARVVIQKQDSATNFMQSTIHQYNQIRTQAKLEMSRELDKMPIGKIQGTKLCLSRNNRLTQDEMEEQNFRRNITSICLFFRDWRWEVQYMNEPDFMLKYSILFGTLLFIGLLIIQGVNANDIESPLFWGFVSLCFLVLVVITLIAWYREIWALCFDILESKTPKRKCSSFLFQLSEKMQHKIIGRIFIYLFLMASLTMCSFVDLIGCDRVVIENEEIDIQLFEDGAHSTICFSPWSVTSCLMLTVAMGFLFTRIPFGLKAVVGIIITGVYVIVVIFEFDFIYEKSPATNVGLYADYSHLLVLVITYLIFLLMDCQTEFITKVDYNWKRQLLKKQDDAQVTNESIKILINNILPSHVADIYISKKMKNELYYEEYDNVAVMFASIRNFDTEKVGLRVLNEIICDFDDVLNFYTGSLKIEKIKVAGWTYMAACGLDVTRSEQRNERNSSLLPNGRRSHYLLNERGSESFRHDSSDETVSASTSAVTSPRNQFNSLARYEGHGSDRRSISSFLSTETATPTGQQNNVVHIMTQFALDLMRTMQSFNLENLQVEDGSSSEHGLLRIGISHGRIMAGVVGSSKPHYDIWGNAVNMASRMDSTGIPGFIQVTQETATILRTFNIQCNYRGLTFVKGRGDIPTYFVGVDKDFHFIKNSATDLRRRSEETDITMRRPKM